MLTPINTEDDEKSPKEKKRARLLSSQFQTKWTINTQEAILKNWDQINSILLFSPQGVPTCVSDRMIFL